MIRKIRAFLAARPGLFGTVSLLYKVARNLAFAVWNLILSLVYGSWWYLTAGVWHGLLGGIRTAASFSVKKREEDGDKGPDSGKSAGQPFVRTLADRISRIGSGEGGIGLVRASGILLVLLSVVVAGTNVLSIRERIADVKGLIPVIGTAAFTFYKMIFAVVRLARKRQGRSARESVLRCTALADSSMAMLTLERTMIASVDSGGTDTRFFTVMTACLGMAVFLVVLWAGIHLLVRAGRMNRYG